MTKKHLHTEEHGYITPMITRLEVDVEAGGEIVERHRTDARDEYFLQTRTCRRLQCRKESAVETILMSDTFIFAKCGNIAQHLVGEVVVLIDKEIKTYSLLIT